MQEGTKLVCRKTLIHINKGKAYGRHQRCLSRNIVHYFYKKKVFTTADFDNINHNPSSSTAQGAFQRTGISHYSINVSCDGCFIPSSSIAQGQVHDVNDVQGPLHEQRKGHRSHSSDRGYLVSGC